MGYHGFFTFSRSQEQMGQFRKAALCQLAVDVRNDSENLKAILHLVEQSPSSELFVFPELVVRSGDLGQADDAGIHPEPDHLVSLDQLRRELGTEAQVIIGGVEIRGGKLYNTAYFLKDEKVYRYWKTHVHWTEPYQAGKDFLVLETALGRTGFLICFDAAFPEVGRVLALRGATVMACIAAVPRHFDSAYMDLRLSSLALNNQAYVLYSNQCGKGFQGHSGAYDPQGRCLARAGFDETVLSVMIEPERVTQWRNEEQIFSRRRPELYGDVAASSLNPPVDSASLDSDAGVQPWSKHKAGETSDEPA